MTWYVYALCEPWSGEVRYVGKSRNPMTRLASHLRDPPNQSMGAWLSGLESPPSIKILDSFEEESDALQFEATAIKWMSLSGRLLNVAHVTRPQAQRAQFVGAGRRMAELRRQCGMTSADISRATGISQATLSHLDSGRRNQMKTNDAIALARCLNTTVEYLFTGESP